MIDWNSVHLRKYEYKINKNQIPKKISAFWKFSYIINRVIYFIHLMFENIINNSRITDFQAFKSNQQETQTPSGRKWLTVSFLAWRILLQGVYQNKNSKIFTFNHIYLLKITRKLVNGFIRWTRSFNRIQILTIVLCKQPMFDRMQLFSVWFNRFFHIWFLINIFHYLTCIQNIWLLIYWHAWLVDILDSNKTYRGLGYTMQFYCKQKMKGKKKKRTSVNYLACPIFRCKIFAAPLSLLMRQILHKVRSMYR